MPNAHKVLIHSTAYHIPLPAFPTAGKAATIRIGTTTTGEAGTEASVENSGTETEAVFDFEIPRGDSGEVTGIEGIPNSDIDSLEGGA